MARFFSPKNGTSSRTTESGPESTSSWTDIADAWLLTEEGHHTAMSMMDRDSRAGNSRQNNVNGLNSLPPTSGSSDQPNPDDIESRLSQSLDLGHETLPSLQRITSEPGVNDSLSTSSIDYLWDADDVPDTRKFNSLPHGGVYSTTANGSLPGSPLNSRRAPEPPDQTDKIKTKLMAAWNNMRHGWTMRRKTSFKYDDPIWMLGNYYHSTTQEREDQQAKQQHGHQVVTSMERFKRDFSSRLWFTYRQNYAALSNSQYTTDVGWGCMIRTGQMMLAQAFLMHYLGREWRWYPSQRPQEVIYHHQIIRLFGDVASVDAPFSLHKLVEIGQRSGKNPGDWYGPASVAHVLSEAVLQAPANPLASQICVYVAQDCTVYKQDVLDLCALMGSRRSSFRGRHSSSTSEDTAVGGERTPGDEPWKALVILIPVRLGGEALNEVYIPCVQTMLTHRMCLGVIGGKPKHSVYFVGWQDDKLIYLDPHFCQDAVDVSDRNFPVHSYHCMSPRKLQFNKMDPSCTLGFYCKTRVDFETFIREAPQLTAPPTDKGHYPMFVVTEGRSCDIAYPSPGKSDRPKHKMSNDRLSARMRVSSKESDDFVFL